MKTNITKLKKIVTIDLTEKKKKKKLEYNQDSATCNVITSSPTELFLWSHMGLVMMRSHKYTDCSYGHLCLSVKTVWHV